jgi:exonuclease SbcC
VRLLSLRLENYRRFALAEVEFPDGVTGLVGRNGAGKSTLLEAVGWALYGHEAARTEKEFLKRRGASGDCRVRLAFELGGETYEVMRELAGRAQAHQAALKVGGRVAVQPGANSAREVTEAITRALRMDREAFFTSLVARQRELQALADLTPGRRREVVLRMLRIDAVDQAIRLAREERRRLQAALDSLAGVQQDPARLASEAAALGTERGQHQQALAAVRQRLEGTEASLGAVGQARAHADELRRRHEALASEEAVLGARAETAERAAQQREREVRALDGAARELARLGEALREHEGLRGEVEALEALRDRHREAQRLRAEAGDLERELEALTRRHEQAAAEAAQALAVRAAVEEARAGRLRLEAALAEARARLPGLDDARKEARARSSQASARRAELQRLGPGTPCPTCERELGAAHPALLQQLDAELRGLEARQGELAQRRDDAERTAARLSLDLAQAHAREDALKKRSEHVVKREAEAELVQRRRADVEARLRDRAAALTALGSVPFDETRYAERRARWQALAKAHERALHLKAQLERGPVLQREIRTLRAEAEQLRGLAQARAAERGALGYEPAAHQALEERWVALQGRARAEAVEAERRSQALQGVEQRLAQVAERQAEQARLEAKLDGLRAEAGLLERLAGERDQGLLADFRAHLLGRLRPALAERAGELFRAITEGRYEGLELTGDYDLLVVEGGQSFPLTRFSGGESDAANLCLRIAIGELLAERSGEQLGFLALDEVLASQDDVRRANVLRALAALRGRFRQILLVTHLDEVQDALEHVLYVRDAPDGTSALEDGRALPVPA